VGIFGGTFDPLHVGHLAAADRARQSLGLEVVLLVVANDPWQKSPGRDVSPAADRLAMARIGVEGHAGLEVCDLEVERGGPSYTIDTVEELAGEGVLLPWLVVGADLAGTLDTWERADELRPLVRVAVLSRPGSPLRLPNGWRSVAIESDDLDISSSDIRRDVRSGISLSERVPDGIIRHIAQQRLYA
jgi:nicotinate-nucleotide adenylyltransferase